MILFIFGLFLLFAGALLALVPGLVRVRALGIAAGIALGVTGLTAIGFSSAVSVNDDQGGVVIRHFGPDLPANRVVAAHDEKGPQAKVLGPGWHFGYWPWLYTVEPVQTVTVETGHLGLVMALDGKPLPPGTIYAPEWPSADELLDGQKFLGATAEQAFGYRGPQLTVLTPGRYRYNPRLFTVEAKPALVVAAGEVAVVKANDGKEYQPTAGQQVEVVNGTPLVSRGMRGLWQVPLSPGAYYLHPEAFSVIKVATTNRVYTYQDVKWAIKVRSKDGFQFPVDVRVGVNIASADAPHLVALLGDPDRTTKDDQEEEALTNLEARVILPNIRTIFRDVAETMNALQFVSSRSQVQQLATERMREELKKYRLNTDGVFVAQIELDHSEAGKQLIATQTDREVAVNQQQTFDQKRKAEESRATFIRAQEEAEQQRQVVQASFQVQVKEQAAKAREAEAKGEASYIQITADARMKAYEGLAKAIGAPGVVQLELLKLVAEGKVQIAPQVMVSGGGGALDALAGTLLRSSTQPAKP